MPDAFSTYTEDFILDWITGTNKYVSLHSADPGGTGTNELTGNGYARPLIAPAGSSVTSSRIMSRRSEHSHVGEVDSERIPGEYRSAQ